jgi:hypothetical protein
LHLMPACNDLQIVEEIVYTKLYIYIYVWSYEKLYDICMVVREIILDMHNVYSM